MSPVVIREGGFTFRFSAHDRDHHPHDPHIHAGNLTVARPASPSGNRWNYNGAAACRTMN